MSKLTDNQCPDSGRVSLAYVCECSARVSEQFQRAERASQAVDAANAAWIAAQISADRAGATFSRRSELSDTHRARVDEAIAKAERAHARLDRARRALGVAINESRAHGNY